MCRKLCYPNEFNNVSNYIADYFQATFVYDELLLLLSNVEVGYMAGELIGAAEGEVEGQGVSCLAFHYKLNVSCLALGKLS